MEELYAIAQNINYISVLVAVIATFVIGSFWYAPPIFGKAWMKEVGMTEAKAKKANMALIMITNLIITYIAGIFLAIALHGQTDPLYGAAIGGIIAVVWIGSGMAMNYMYEQRTVKLWLINTGYQLISYAAMGAIIASWPA